MLVLLIWKYRRAFAVAMLCFVLEALCVLGRAPGPVEHRMRLAGAAFATTDRPKQRTGSSKAMGDRSP